MILFFCVSALAQTTNDLSDAEIQGRVLAQKILEQKPADSFTNTGTLEIRRHDGTIDRLPFRFQAILTTTNWQAIYETTSEGYRVKFAVVHDANKIRLFQIRESGLVLSDFSFPLAMSDFWLGDLGLEFFHWPEQKILKKEVHRSRGCTVLESTNPNPGTNGYSRVVSWIDNETLGIVEAYAYDAQGKKLKDFYPKDFKKVNGQWQVQTLVMENVQTKSRSVLEFDVKKE